MKKSLITKLILMILVLSLICCVAVACGDKTPAVTDDPKDPVIEEPEADLVTELVNIIKSVGPLVTTLNGIEQSSTLSIDAGIGVNFDFGTTSKGEYGATLKANLDSTNPQLNLSLNTDSDDDRDVVLAYKAGKGYLKQPITKINTTAGGEDECGLELEQLRPSVLELMKAAMYGLSADWQEDVTDEEDNTKYLSKEGSLLLMDFDALGTSIEGLLTDLGLNIESLVTLTTDAEEGTSKLTIGSANAKTIVGLVKTTALSGYSDIIDSVINALLPEADGQGWKYINSAEFVFPNLFVEAKIVTNEVKALSLGINYEGLGITDKEDYFARLDIDLNTFGLQDALTIDCPTADLKSFKAEADLDMVDKNMQANLVAFLTGNMQNKTTTEAVNSLANGTLSFTNGLSNGTVNAFFDDTAAFFDLTDAFNAVGGIDPTTPTDTFKASIKDRGDTEETLNDTINMYDLLENSLKDWNSVLQANEPEPPQEGGYTLMQSIYDMLGGDVEALSGKDPSEEQIVTAFLNTFGDYLVPTLGENPDYDSYSGLIDAASAHFKAEETTIKGIFGEQTAWADVANNTEWVGTAKLYLAGDDNDLLDIVNNFICNGVDGDGHAIPYDVDFLTGVVNRYIAVICRTDSTLNTDPDVAAYTTALAALDNEYLFWKNMDHAGYITQAQMEEYADAHYEGLLFDNGNEISGHTAQYFANLVISDLFGYRPTENLDTDNFLAIFIESGVEGKVFCKKGDGLNGRIELWDNANTTGTAFVKLGGKVSIVAADQTTGKYEVSASVLDLTDIEYRGPDFTPDDKFRIVEKYDDGVEKLVGLESGKTWTAYDAEYSFDLENLGGKTYAKNLTTDYEENYVNAETVLTQLFDLLEGYKNVGQPS